MIELTRTVKLVLVGVGVSSAAILLFFLLRKDDDEDEDIGRKKKSSAATSHQTVIEMKIPKKAVGAVIGRQGATIKEVQEESGAKINFKDDTQAEDGDRTAIIRGTSEAAQTAECMIRKIIADMPVIVQEQMSVPKYAVGRIIGRGGESIRQMSRASKARILIDKTKDVYRDQPQVITIQGSKQQIDVAKSLIQEKLDEEEEFRAKQAVSAANREVRKPTREHAENHHHHHREGEMITDNENNSFSSPVPSDGKPGTCAEFPKGPEYVEVYVSAIASPGHFWVQVIGSLALQLDRLSVDMTRFYDHEGKDLMLSAVKKGDIVAAPFENDKTWYRAQVMEILPDNKVDLFYVDYGDSTYLDKSFIKHLNTEFLVLPFQAIECRLAGLKPNGEWSEEAFDRFEELTYCAKWKRILAKATKFTGSIPHLELIDTNNYQDVNINEEMIKSGFAVPET